MKFLEATFEKVRRHPKRIVFPESGDERILRAAADYVRAGLGSAILLGPRDLVRARARGYGLPIEGVGVIDPERADDLERYASTYARMRGASAPKPEEAIEAVKNPLLFATMMLLGGSADGMVAGLHCGAAAIYRPLLQAIRLEPGTRAASACAVLQFEDSSIGEGGILCCADCGVIPEPNADQLADIAVSAAKLARQMHSGKPRVAFLAYTTRGAARHRSLEKIQAAIALARDRAAAKFFEAEFDGEFQADAALSLEAAEAKGLIGPVAGRASVLVFPDLNSGNISVKLLQQIGRAHTYGPLLLGLSKPASDLARRIGVKEIVGAAALVALQAIEYRKLYPDSGRASAAKLLY
jgi:phosphate acetyltransferase